MPPKSFFVIVNPVAGFKKDKSRLIGLLESSLKDQRVVIYQTKSRGDATDAASEAANEDYDAIVAVGGDGTVNEVASGLCGSAATLGIIPIGSGNGLARALKIPIAVRHALKVLLNGEKACVDMGKAGPCYFCAVAGVGIDAIVARGFNRSKWRGPLPYFLISAKELLRFQATDYQISFDSQSIRYRPFIATAANTPQFGNGAIIAPAARADDGYLDFCLVPELPKAEIMAAVPQLFRGTLDRNPNVEYFKVKKVEIRADRPILFHVDGDPVETTEELTIEVLPKALNVLVPRPAV